MIRKVFFLFFLFSYSWGFPLISATRLTITSPDSYFFQDHMGLGTYAFAYDIEDPSTGNVQFRQEERHANGTVTGSYGYVNADGKILTVNYISDENGYRAIVEKEGGSPQRFP